MTPNEIRAIILAAALGTCGCTSVAAEPVQNPPLDWLTGCWQSPDGTYREVWSQSEHGYYFGYAISLKDSAVSFFEQTRIDPGSPAVMNAYPAGEGPSPFPESDRTENSITFANPAHDYPQRIAYRTTDKGLAARISLEDGTEARDFDFIPCPQPH